MELAISGEALGSDMELKEILSILKENGVHAIEIWPENIPLLEGRELVHKRLYANRDIKRAKEILENAGVKTACVCFGAGFDKALAADRELFAEELTRAVEVAHELGAKVVNHYCYHVNLGNTWTKEELHGYYDKAIRAAGEYGIYLALENEAHDITRNPVWMKQIVEAMDSPWFRTNYDATNYYQAGFEGFPYAYEVLKDFIVHVHIKNGCIYHPEMGHEKVLSGGAMTGLLEGQTVYYPVASDGAVNIDGMLRRLRKDGYQGYCSLEPHTIPELCLKYYSAETQYLRERGFD